MNGGTALILALGDDDSGVEITLRAVLATWMPVIGGVTESAADGEPMPEGLQE